MMDHQTIILSILGGFALLQVKHLIIDWMWQPSFEYLNKGKLFHWGGIRHAGKNAIGTFAVLAPMFGLIALPLALLDFVVHYFIDYSKVNINNHYRLKPDQHPEFWWLTGLDQCLHQLTYIWLIYLAVMASI